MGDTIELYSPRTKAIRRIGEASGSGTDSEPFSQFLTIEPDSVGNGPEPTRVV